MPPTPDPDRSEKHVVPVPSDSSESEPNAERDHTDLQNDDSIGDLDFENLDLNDAQQHVELLVQKAQAWALWRIFVVPHLRDVQKQSEEQEEKEKQEGQEGQEGLRKQEKQERQDEREEQKGQREQEKQKGQVEREERENQGETGLSGSKDNSSQEDFIPDSDELRQSGIMDYIRQENGLLGFDELLCTDIILKYQRILTPTTPGVDRYDDWGVSRWEESVCSLMHRFYSLSPRQRREEWEKIEDIVSLSPEICAKMRQLKELLDLPASPEAKGESDATKKSPEEPSNLGSIDRTNDENEGETEDVNEDEDEDNTERMYPPGVKGLEAEFDVLSSSKTSSARLRAIETLDLLLSDESDDLSELKAKTQKLLRRYPVLERCNPYLLKLIRSGSDALSVDAVTSEEYSIINTHLTPFFFPVWLDDPDLCKQRFWNSWKKADFWLAFVLTIVWFALLWGFYLFLNQIIPVVPVVPVI